MAKYGKTLAEVKVHINGREQAQKELDALKQSAKALDAQISEANNRLLESSKNLAEARKRANDVPKGSPEETQATKEYLNAQHAFDEASKALNKYKAEKKQLDKSIRESEQLTVNLEEALAHLSEQDLVRLRKLRREVAAVRDRVKGTEPENKTFLEALNSSLEQIDDTIKNKQGKLVEFGDILNNLGGTSDEKLAAVHKRLDELIRKSVDGSDEMKAYKAELQEVIAEEQKRVKLQATRVQEQVQKGQFKGTIEEIQQAIELQKQYQKQLDSADAEGLEKVQDTIDGLNKKLTEAQKTNAMDTLTKNLGDSSTGQIKQSVDFLVKYRESLQPLSPEWKKVNDAIEAGNAKLKEYTDQTKLQAMSSQFKQLGSLSTSALSDQKKYWQEMVDGAAAGSKELTTYESRLKKVIAEEQKRSKENAGKVMGNLTDYSVNEIKEAIKATEQLRDAQKPGSKAWAEYAAQVKNANDYLDSFKNKAQFEAMNTQFKNLGKLSADALAEQKKYWQSMVNGAANGSKELEQYRKKLTEVTAEEQKRSAASVKSVMASPTKYSVNEIREAIKVTEQLRDAQVPGSKAWKEYAEQVANANAVLDKFKDKAKIEAMTTQLRNLGTLSKSALAEQKKFWQAMADGAEKGSKELEQYEQKLKLVVNEEKARTKEQGKGLTNNVLSGQWAGTVGEAKEAVKVLKEYKDTLSTTDTAGIKRVDKAISELTNKTKIAETGFKNTNDALNALVRQTRNLGNGNFKGSISELEEMRRKLITIRETQDKVLSAKDRDRLTKAIQRVDKELGLAKGELLDINHVLANMKDTPLKTLERAAAQLQSEIRDCSEATGEFTAKAAQLRRVNAQVDKLKKSFKEKENVIMRTAKRLMAYVAVYGGFNFVIGKVKELTQANLQLSDSYADIQKTTGLTSKQVKDLSKSIDSIDTRTTQQQLHELAATAGQLGLKSQTDILGFVKASNMISVSLNELGAEGTSSLMKIAKLTGEASEGTEQALLKIGSAINELTANSAATAGPIVDLMKRMGGVASQAGLTSSQMAAIGATADALGQSMEITGTSMNKFVTTLMSSSDEIAYALNMDAKALRNMLDEGKTMEAMIAVFEKMQKMGGMKDLAGVMGDLGSEGARMTQVLTAMAKNVDFLKTQVDLSAEAYENASSIQNEYNIKNENALAIWQRIGNMLKELFVNSFFVDILTGISRGIHNVLDTIIQGEYFFKILASSIAAVTAAIYANTAAWVQNLNAMGFVKGAEALLNNIGDKLAAVWDTVAGAVSGGVKSFSKFTKEAWAATQGTNAFKRACDLAGMSVKKLGQFLSRNWLTIAIAALSALVAWLVTAATRVTELTRATARYHREVEEEKNKVDALFSSLKRLNSTEADRAKTIATINQQYGSYLGFMLSEKDSAEKLAAAHKLINSELERRMALNLQSTLQGKASNVYAEQYEKASTEIGSIIKGEGLFDAEDLKGKVNSSEVTSYVSSIINEIVSQAVTTDSEGKYRELGEIDKKSTLESIKKKMQEKFNNEDLDKEYAEGLGFGGALFQRTSSQIETLLEARIEYMEDILEAEKTADLEMGRITKSAEQDRKALLAQTEANIKSLQDTKVGDDWTEEKTQEHYANLLHQLRSYVSQSETIRKGMSDEEKKQYEKDMKAKEDAYKAYYNKIAPLAGEDPWGKTLNVSDWKDFADIVTNLDTASAESLASAYKKITEDTAKIPSNVKQFYKMFEGTGLETKLKLQNPDDIAKQIHKWAEQIKEKLATKYGRNTSLGFIFESEGSGGKKTAKQMYDGWLAALEAYYNERATLIRQNGMKEKKLETEINRELEALNAEKLANQRELEEGLLNDMYKNSTFDPTKFKGVITGTEYFANLTLEQMRGIVSAGGPKLDAEIRKNMTERMVKLEEQAYKIKQRIDKILLEDDFTEKVAKEYTDALDQLGLLFNMNYESQSRRTEEEGERRLAYMREWAKDSYSLNAQQLQSKMEQEKLFSDWVIKRKPEEYEALLIQLRKFHDDELEAEKKAADRRKKLFDNSEKGMKLKKDAQTAEQNADKNVKTEEEEAKMWDRFKGMDLVSDDKLDEQQIEVGNAQIALYQAKIDASNAYIAQLQLEMAVEKEKVQNTIDNINRELSNTNLSAEQRTKLNADLLAAEQKKNSLIRQEEIITEGEKAKIRENEANQVEVSQDIADRLVAIEQNKISRMKQYTDAIVDFSGQMGEAAFGEVEDRKEAGRQLIKTLLTTLKEHMQVKLTELVMEKMFAQQSTATTAGQVSTEMTLKAAETEADIVAGTASATAKEAGKKGWIGLAVGAAIGAALSALLGLAMGAINKAKSTSDSISGNKKLATGMLTYAEGNYPVLGNDGKVYDAKYEGSNIKTGVYGGGAHFGIFSEKQPEMIVDGKTTQKLILNYPYIYDAITTIAKNGRLVNAMPTFATGDYPAGMQRIAQVEAVDASGGANPDMERMSAALEQTQEVNRRLLKVLEGGLVAHVDGLENYKQQKKNERFLKRRGID